VSLTLQIALGIFIVFAAFVLAIHLFHPGEKPGPRVSPPDPPRKSPAREPEDPRRQEHAADPRPLDEAGRAHLEELAEELRQAAAVVRAREALMRANQKKLLL
jgi:hypothetical protein